MSACPWHKQSPGQAERDQTYNYYSFLQIILDIEFCLVKCLSVCSFDFGVTVSQHLVDYIWT